MRFGGLVKHACLALLVLALFAPVAVDAADADSLAPRDFLRLKPHDAPPVKCDADHVGTIAADSKGELCVCHRYRAADGKEVTAWAGVPGRMVQCGFSDQ